MSASSPLLLRNALVFENQADLELCWGVPPEWLRTGSRIVVKRAPTKFGEIDLELQRPGQDLVLEYRLKPGAEFPKPQEVRLHIPSGHENIGSVRVNGVLRSLTPGVSVLKLN